MALIAYNTIYIAYCVESVHHLVTQRYPFTITNYYDSVMRHRHQSIVDRIMRRLTGLIKRISNIPYGKKCGDNDKNTCGH